MNVNLFLYLLLNCEKHLPIFLYVGNNESIIQFVSSSRSSSHLLVHLLVNSLTYLQSIRLPNVHDTLSVTGIIIIYKYMAISDCRAYSEQKGEDRHEVTVSKKQADSMDNFMCFWGV